MDNNPGISIFQSTGIHIDSPLQNQEEDEDLEEQKKRQEEIQNFLTNAMDEFNYDEQSTINSSTNLSIDEGCNTQSNILQKYKNANLDEQLKVLYEVRVREVKSLSEQLEQMKVEIEKQKDANKKITLLLEAEKDRVKISSEQAKILLVNKTEEISKLKSEIDAMKATILSLETTVKAVNDEYTLCKQSNKELVEQLSLMHNGLTTNTISDRQLQEQHHAEVSHLHHLLDSANMKLHRKEKEFKELEQKLGIMGNEKDNITAEKARVINHLTQNLESALERCQEFSERIEKISQENRTLKLSATYCDLTDSIRTMGLTDKTEIVKALQRELEKTREVKSKVEGEADLLREAYEKLSRDCKNLEMSCERYENELEMWRKKYGTLEEDFNRYNTKIRLLESELEEHRKNSEIEGRKYQHNIKLLEGDLENYKNKKKCDNLAQTSFILDNTNNEEEKQELKSKINILEAEIELLNKKLLDSEGHISQMQLQVSLERERETLIKSLQEKAAKFEEIIKQKQKGLDCISVGVNTDAAINTEMHKQENLLRTKFETELVQKEIEVRTEAKKDFDLKLEMLQKEFLKKTQDHQGKQCEQCKDLSSNLNQLKILKEERDKEINFLKQQMRDDREAVATLLEEWSNKFLQMENEKLAAYSECANFKETCHNLLLKLKTKEAGDFKLYEVIKKECEETIKMWNKNTLKNLQRFSSTQQENIKESSRRIEECCRSADAEVYAIELQFQKKKQLMENSISYNKNLKRKT